MPPQAPRDPQPRSSLLRTLRLHYSETLFQSLFPLPASALPPKPAFSFRFIPFPCGLGALCAPTELVLILRFCPYFPLFLEVKGL